MNSFGRGIIRGPLPTDYVEYKKSKRVMAGNMVLPHEEHKNLSLSLLWMVEPPSSENISSNRGLCQMPRLWSKCS